MSDQPGHVENMGAESVSPPKTWGIYVYFAADIPDPAMRAAAWTTLGTLASVGSSATVKITAMIDLPGKDTEYYIFPPRPNDPKVTRWPILPDRFLSNVNSASIDTILDFFEWSNRNCPADNIALIFWGHGYALDDYNPRIHPQGAQASRQPAGEAKGRTANSFPGDSGNELKLLYDVTHNSVLNNHDFAEVIRDYTEIFNKRAPIQVLGLDCCNMAMAEVLSELQGVAEYAVAAETGLPFQSWLSASILEKFLQGKHQTARDFAVNAVKDFVGSFSNSSGMYIELSACNLNRFSELETAMKNLVAALLSAIDKHGNRSAVLEAWQNDVSFVSDGLIDLASFCGFLAKSVDPSEKAVRSAAAGVQTAVKNVVDWKGIAPSVAGRRIALSTGLSVWFPPWIQFPNVRYFQMKQSKNYLFNGYSSTQFAKVTGWDRFLLKLFELTQQKLPICSRG